MCGFVASFNLFTKYKTEDMLALIKHRGPDSSRVVSKLPWQFGFNRLGIVARDSLYDQPYTEDKTFYLLFNGEIYNFADLAHKYIPHHRPISDTQVLFKLLKLKGVEIVKELDGIFAFIFVDTSTDCVIAARDYFGVKPLYYCKEDHGIVFSSELKPLQRYANSLYANNTLLEYITHGSVLNGNTIYKTISQIERSTIAQYSPKTGFEFKRYELVKAVKSEFPVKSAITSQIPDIDFGIMYSGGIDSTILLQECAAHARLKHTFSICVEHPEMNELNWQKQGLMTIKPNSIHHTIKDTEHDFSIDSLYSFNCGLDLPISHPSFIGALKIASLANSLGLKVLLCGEGADEIFHGYRWHLQQREFSNDLPSYLNQIDIADALSVDISSIPKLTTITHDEFFFNYYLPRWLVRADLTGMKYSIENRVPFLSNIMFSFSKTLTLKEKTKSYTVAKAYLKDYLSSTFPKSFVHRKKKGFDYPLNTWCNNEIINLILNSDSISPFFKKRIRNEFNSDYRIPRACFVLASFLLWNEMA